MGYQITLVCGLLWVTAVFSVAQNGDDPCAGQTINGDSTVPHEQLDGSVFCCVRQHCNLGTYAECSLENPVTVCKPCPDGTYRPHAHTSEHVLPCQTKTSCKNEGMEVKDEGSRDEDRTCQCKLSEGYYDFDWAAQHLAHHRPECHKRKCPAGKQLTREGKCVSCEWGNFKAEKGYEPCKKWSTCSETEELIIGNSTTDSTCINKTVVITGEILPPKVGESKPSRRGPPYDMIFGILGAVMFLFLVFVILLFVVHNQRHKSKEDSEKQSMRDEVSSTTSSMSPHSRQLRSLSPLNIQKAKTDFSKVRHGSSPDSGIADMKGYAPYFPSSEKLTSNNTGNNFQYAKDIQEDCGSSEEGHNSSFQEPIPEEEDDTMKEEDSRSVDTLNDKPVVNHYYYFPQHGNVNLQLGNDNKLYVGGAPTESPPTPEDYCTYNAPLYSGVDYTTSPLSDKHSTSKHTVV